MAKYYIPRCNPLHYTQVDRPAIPQYLSKHMDDVPYLETIRPWQQCRTFFQVWGTADTIRQQIHSEVAPVKLKVLDIDGIVKHQDLFLPKQQNFYKPGAFIYEHNLALNAFPPGVYFCQLEIGSLVFISDPIKISNSLADTLLLEYKHHRYHLDVIFETGFYPSIRITGSLNLKSPQSKDTIFEDQVLGMTLQNSKPFRIMELLLNGPAGIPNWMIDKLNLILGCSTLSIDGRLHTKSAEGAKLEEKAFNSSYPMKGWSIDLRERYTRYSEIYEDDQAVNGQLVAIANVDSKGFGTEGGGNIQQIQDVF